MSLCPKNASRVCVHVCTMLCWWELISSDALYNVIILHQLSIIYGLFYHPQHWLIAGQSKARLPLKGRSLAEFTKLSQIQLQGGEKSDTPHTESMSGHVKNSLFLTKIVAKL